MDRAKVLTRVYLSPHQATPDKVTNMASSNTTLADNARKSGNELYQVRELRQDSFARIQRLVHSLSAPRLSDRLRSRSTIQKGGWPRATGSCARLKLV